MDELTELIIQNENLIYSIAHKFTQYRSKDDLFQAGCLGMIKAYENYDPSKGVKFTSYAYKYILGEMNELIREDKSIKLSRDLGRLKSRIEKAIVLLEQELFRKPTSLELSSFLEIPSNTIDMLLNYKECYSMDESFGEDLSFYEVIADKEIDYDTLIALKTELQNLGEPERSIMIERYFSDLTQTEVANSLGLSQVDVSRREHKVLTKLRRTFN